MSLVAVLLTQGLVANGPLRFTGNQLITRTHGMITMEVIDNRRAGRGKKPKLTQFGTDPRGDTAGTRKAPEHWDFPAPGTIGTLDSTDMLQDALDCSDHDRHFVVLKFVSDTCEDYPATKLKLQTASEKYKGDGHFYKVIDPALHEMAKVTELPCVHLYARNKLQAALSLKPDEWGSFEARLWQVHQECLFYSQ